METNSVPITIAASYRTYERQLREGQLVVEGHACAR